MRRLKFSTQLCKICFKGDSVSFNRPKSLHRTKRVVRPNLQKYTALGATTSQLVCTRCARTLRKEFYI
ncbi:50S ribosomal protein L28 [Candidatus Berkelbacteria bacterium]|nr:50S ribosomal protein L28 [Candidatus Berkelbacteria bacterium]PIR28187.1 MAG: 50S ribosomal protein L28 [Candidatus Berkelbacteria bacterium CG11_big_fil_rev_8_21_14_0_20_40_23]PIZ28660.1 MAG: 50S ribosomal protein L28 [Candidatus Berkelbacteria bacterium CG_4_10_14_0_8_um_filter_39_42]